VDRVGAADVAELGEAPLLAAVEGACDRRFRALRRPLAPLPRVAPVELLAEVLDDREALLEMRLGDVVDVGLEEVLGAERLGGGRRALPGGGRAGRRGGARCEQQREGQDACEA
jgi:hypothetical protein